MPAFQASQFHMKTTVYLDQATSNRLDTWVRLTNGDHSLYVREAINEYLDDMEDIYFGKRALSQLERTYTLEEVKHELDL